MALPYVSDAVDHSLKSDGSPVSACDLAVERALIEFLTHYRPNDGILSEELGEVALGERRWLLDPIDGTSQFVSGGAEWGTHVALEIGAQILLGIITRPLQRKRWWGVVGDGAFVDDDVSPDARSTRLRVSDSLGSIRCSSRALRDWQVHRCRGFGRGSHVGALRGLAHP